MEVSGRAGNATAPRLANMSEPTRGAIPSNRAFGSRLAAIVMAHTDEFPITAIPGGRDTGYVAAAVVMALTDLLVEKGTITRGDLMFLRQSLSERVGKLSRAGSKEVSDLLGHWVTLQENIEK